MGKYAIGLDFGTNSCRSLLVDAANGRELASHVFPYPSGLQLVADVALAQVAASQGQHARPRHFQACLIDLGR